MAGMYGCFKGKSSDGAAMASGPADATANQEPAEAAEECSGKKKSKFQTFKKFFARKKRKEAPASGGEAGLKASQSSDNVSKTPESNTLTRSEKDKGSGSKISLGSKALSHDSVFVSDSSEANEALGASQDSIHGKVKSLQLQLKQAIRLGSPPSLMCVKKTEDGGTMSEDDGLPCSPPEYSTHHTVQDQPQRNSSISLEGTESDEDQLFCAASSRAVSPLVAAPGDFSQPASPFSCLDNSAAKHKLGLRHKACTKRKPVSRLEVRAEGDSSVEEMLSNSIPEALEEREDQKMEDDQLKPKKEEENEEEEEEEKEEEEAEPPQHSRQSLLGDKEREEGEDEQEAGQGVSQSPETSSPLEPCLSEEEVPDTQPLASSGPSSRASSPDSPRATPEPPAHGSEEDRAETDAALAGEDNEEEAEEEGVLSNTGRDNGEEESSFLEEVLSSLKTPLSSCSLGLETEGIVLEMKMEEQEVKDRKAEVKDFEEVEEKEKEEVETEGDEMKEESAEVDEPVNHQTTSSDSLPLDQNTQEEDVDDLKGTTSSYQAVEEEEEEEEEELEKEKEAEKKEEKEEEEEEELEMEQFSQHGQEEEKEKQEVEEVKDEEEKDLPIKTEKQQEDEGEHEENKGEKVVVELEKVPDVEEQEEEEEERIEEDNEEVGGKERIEEAEEVKEGKGDDTEKTTEMLPDGFKSVVPVLEANEELDVMLGEDTVSKPQLTDEDQIPAELCDQIVTASHESQATSVDERSDEEERAEEGVDIDHTEQKSDREEDSDVKQPDVEEEGSDQAGLELDSEISHLDMNQMEKDQTDVGQTVTDQATVCIKPLSLSLPESQGQSQDSQISTPTKTSSNTSTTTIHINLVSPSSEKARSAFQLSPSAADVAKEIEEAPSHADVEQNSAQLSSTDEEPAETVDEEQGKLSTEAVSTQEEEARPVSTEETVIQLSSPSDKSKVRFTIAPAWQRSLSIGDGNAKESVSPHSPSSPPASVSSISSSSPSTTGPEVVEMTATTEKDPLVKAEASSSAKAEVLLSPGRSKNAGSSPAKPQSGAATAPGKPHPSAAAATEESAVLVEGNPDNPFGVRLRKTAVLHLYSSEEENTETAPKPPAQPTNSKVNSQQPISVKPSTSQPISIKPALPKKPDVHGDSGGKAKQTPDSAAARGVSGGSDSPSWISVAKQKQKIYKETSLEEITAKKEDPERKFSLPLFVSSSCREHSKTPESTGKVSPLEITKSPSPVEKEARRVLSPPTPVPPQPTKQQSLPCTVAPKPQVTPPTPKHQPQPNPSHRALSPPTPVPVSPRSPSCTSPPSLSKPAMPLTSKSPPPQNSPLSTQRPPQSGSTPARAAGVSSQPQSPQRGLAPALPQDEPPWMALAKKKAKAWSEMPQIVQ